MTLFIFRRVKSHGWTFYDPINNVKGAVREMAAVFSSQGGRDV